MENITSSYLEDFIDFLEAADEQYSMSMQDLEDTNVDLQDLQHFIEFGKADGKKRLKIYELYHQTRVKRRNAKETLEQLAPIVEWYDKNSQCIQDLRAVLGSVRKIEKLQDSRVYAIRGHILDGITDLTHLRGDNSEEDIG